MRTLLTILVAVGLLLPSLAGAEYYKYRDQRGVVRFTDNILEVPEDQRGDENRYASIETAVAATQSEAADTEAKPDDAGRPGLPAGDQLSQAERQALELLPKADQLNAQRKALEEEYVALVKAKEALVKTKATMKPNELERYNQQVRQLNAKVADFEKRRSAFQQDVNQFNQKVAGQ